MAAIGMSIEGVFVKISCISTFIVDDEPACAWVGRGEERMRRNAGIEGSLSLSLVRFFRLGNTISHTELH